MSSTYSVFIPRVFSNIRTNRISDTFHNLNIGDVEKVDLVAKTSKNGDSYNMAFVHFKGFYETQEAIDFRKEVEDPEIKAKLVYEDPWFWLVLPFEKKEKPVNEAINDTGLEIQGFQQQPQFQPQPHQQHFQQQPQFQPQFQPHQQMVQFHVMTPQGPMLQWGFPIMDMVSQEQVPSPVKRSRHRNQPRKRINVPHRDITIQSQVEEGQIDDSDCDDEC